MAMHKENLMGAMHGMIPSERQLQVKKT